MMTSLTFGWTDHEGKMKIQELQESAELDRRDRVFNDTLRSMREQLEEQADDIFKLQQTVDALRKTLATLIKKLGPQEWNF